MPRIVITTEIRATPERCFDLARDLDLHRRSMLHTGEQAVAGRVTGLLGPGETVTWRGRHLGLVHEHTAKITAFDRPRHFRDTMVRGRFASFVHDHTFEPIEGGTRMTDVVEFRSPFGPLDRIVDAWVLEGYLSRLLRGRGEVIRAAAESSSVF